MAEHCSRLHADLFAVDVLKFLPHIRNYDVDGAARAKHESPKFASHLFLSHSPPPKLKTRKRSFGGASINRDACYYRPGRGFRENYSRNLRSPLRVFVVWFYAATVKKTQRI